MPFLFVCLRVAVCLGQSLFVQCRGEALRAVVDRDAVGQFAIFVAALARFARYGISSRRHLFGAHSREIVRPCKRPDG